MLRILIVDDEPFFLEFMQDFLRSCPYSCQLVGAAADGRKAMEILESSGADVIFTDIKMPVMDGLELICSAMELDPAYQFVVLSSYSDFHMVGQAFKLGAKDYVLKQEITPEQILDILKKCEERREGQLLEKQRGAVQKQRFAEMSAQLRSLQALVDSSRREMKKRFLSDLLYKNIPFSEAGKLPGAAAFLPEEPPAAALLVKLDDYYRLLRDTWENDSSLFEFALHNIFEEICAGFPGTVFFCFRPDEYLLFTSERNGRFALQCRLRDLYAAVKAAFQSSLLMETILSTSGTEPDPAKTAARMVEEAERANSAFFLLGKAPLLTFCPTAGGRGGIEDKVPSFRQLLAARDTKGLKDRLAEYQIRPETADPSQIPQIRAAFFRYAFYIREYAAENNATQRIYEDLAYFEDYLKYYGTLAEMNQWLEKVATALLQQEYHSSSLVKRVKKYVLANYFQELSLTGIAEEMGVNPNYLSRSFSKEYGDSLISYINTVRLQAAASLLKNTNLKNYEIAERVGYQNVEYFARVFKKTMGVTPGEYRSGAE